MQGPVPLCVFRPLLRGLARLGGLPCTEDSRPAPLGASGHVLGKPGNAAATVHCMLFEVLLKPPGARRGCVGAALPERPSPDNGRACNS